MSIKKNQQKRMRDDAAEQTLALNPLVGMTTEEVVGAAKATAFQAIRQPLSVFRSGFGYTRKLVEVAFGERDYKPLPKDRRFADSSWKNSWIHRGMLQSYLAMVESLDEWVDDAGFDGNDARRARFVMKILGDSVSPTNVLPGNPAAVKQLIDTGGKSVADGLKNFIHDRRFNNGMPSQVDKSKFNVGENLATTPGAVVFRNELLELIQYTPTTAKVHRRPILFIPPQINKFYVYDLTSEKSFFKFCVDAGLQTFTVSWRNPGPEHADWGIDHYIRALKEAVEVVQGISASKTINVCAPCSGGITGSILAAHYKALGQDVIHSMTLPVCVLTQEDSDNELALFTGESAVELARANSRKNGVLRGQDLAMIFSWMRPNDLIWNYVINNYLLGNRPPAFDILYWNNDTTNLPAQLHSDFLDIVGQSALARPDDLSVCDTDIDLQKVDCDKFLIGGLTDHLTRWEACYRTIHLTRGAAEFVLVGSGHIQSLVTAPGNPKARYFLNENTPDTPQEWLDSATEHSDTWWPHWSEWIRSRSGAQKNSPNAAGSKAHPALCDAPGTYVLEPAA